MGTVLEIELGARDEAAARAILERCFARVAELERLFTRFDPASALSRLNREAGRGPVPVDPALARILADAREYSRLTRGSFDVTLGPLVELWSAAGRRGRVPDPQELAAALARVGAEGIEVSEPGATAALAREGMSVDLGGIAKGWALDRVAEILASQGVTSAFASFGGSSFLALGAPLGEDGWRVLLGDAGGGFAGALRLEDLSLSVSGSLGQSTEIAGRRYGHVIDPRSGEPLVRAAQAAVVAKSGALAEAFSKALLVLGEEEGMALLEEIPDAEGYLVAADGRSRRTSGWDRTVRFEGWSGDARRNGATRSPRRPRSPRLRGPRGGRGGPPRWGRGTPRSSR
jgi:thiamine biosynthesis lipoprotein